MGDGAELVINHLSSTLSIASTGISLQKAEKIKGLLDKFIKFYENIKAISEIIDKCPNNMRALAHYISLLIIASVFLTAISAAGVAIGSKCPSAKGKIACTLFVDYYLLSYAVDFTNDILESERQDILRDCK